MCVSVCQRLLIFSMYENLLIKERFVNKNSSYYRLYKNHRHEIKIKRIESGHKLRLRLRKGYKSGEQETAEAIYD